MIEIRRIETKHDATVGVLTVDGEIMGYTLELPWRGNQRNVSCIPAGEYVCRRVDSPRYGSTYEVCDVPGRSHILVHLGNTVNDTQGCILVGLQTGWLYEDRAVMSSRIAVNNLLTELAGVDETRIRITDEVVA